MTTSTNKNFLEVRNLDVRFRSNKSDVHALKSISFSVEKGQSVGIVGESGSGKSVTSLSLLDLYRNTKSVFRSGDVTINLDGTHICVSELEERALQNIRGKHVGLVLQEPGSALNPVRKCGPQIVEVLKCHRIGGSHDLQDIVRNALLEVALSDVDRIYNAYPHELSGGQLQRVCIAMAIVCRPSILICDEITSALDVTIQKEIIDLLNRLRKDMGLTLLFISHDLDVVREVCDRIVIMYEGEIVEEGNIEEVFLHASSPYTKELLVNKPSISKRDTQDSNIMKSDKVLEVSNLSHSYQGGGRGIFKKSKNKWVLSDIGFSLYRGEILGIVGESGSGKSTIAKSIVGIINPTKGTINYTNKNKVTEVLTGEPRKDIQLVFQDPYSSLNPSMSIGKGLYELLRYHRIVPKTEIKNRITTLLEQVGLSNSVYDRLPRELSGGQRQRVCIAKALSLEPKVLICDECVSALDVTVQAKILGLLLNLRLDLGLSLLFISHDLAVINEICDRVLVMDHGRIVESGAPFEIINTPQNPYTQRLISSIPGQ